jgi:glycerophosphoryl diester phosphodiesterase
MNSLRMPVKMGSGVLNIAHRGARAFAPENTLVAFMKAKTFGCQMIEIDVRLSKDDQLIVHHDENLSRCTDVQEKFPDLTNYDLWNFTYDQLSSLDAGSWYVEQLSLPCLERQAFLQIITEDELTQFVSPHECDIYASGEIKLPTLKQTLEFAKDIDMMVNIELKTQPDKQEALAVSVVKLVELMSMEHKILISSFDHDLLRKVRQMSDTIAIGVLTSALIKNLKKYMQLIDADAYHPNCYGESNSNGIQKLNLGGIASALEDGNYVNVWTCNNKEDLRQLLACGVSGVISDFPNRVKEALKQFNTQ